jgi:hypothetical protein
MKSYYFPFHECIFELRSIISEILEVGEKFKNSFFIPIFGSLIFQHKFFRTSLKYLLYKIKNFIVKFKIKITF